MDGEYQDEPVPDTNRYDAVDNRIDIALDDGVKSSLWWATNTRGWGSSASGRQVEARYGGFAGEPFGDDSREYVFVARR